MSCLPVQCLPVEYLAACPPLSSASSRLELLGPVGMPACRLSRGQAAKKRGTGSRAICHRLNEMERKEFELAKKMGFVQLRGTGYR